MGKTQEIPEHTDTSLRSSLEKEKFTVLCLARATDNLDLRIKLFIETNTMLSVNRRNPTLQLTLWIPAEDTEKIAQPSISEIQDPIQRRYAGYRIPFYTNASEHNRIWIQWPHKQDLLDFFRNLDTSHKSGVVSLTVSSTVENMPRRKIIRHEPKETGITHHDSTELSWDVYGGKGPLVGFRLRKGRPKKA